MDVVWQSLVSMGQAFLAQLPLLVVALLVLSGTRVVARLARAAAARLQPGPGRGRPRNAPATADF